MFEIQGRHCVLLLGFDFLFGFCFACTCPFYPFFSFTSLSLGMMGFETDDLMFRDFTWFIADKEVLLLGSRRGDGTGAVFR
jgi:hypothetical protein